MKSLLIAIKPKWCAKIMNGEKKIEIRKTAPKCDLPIDVYIYCTRDKKCLVAPFHFVEGWKYKEYNDKTNYAGGCLRNMGDTINGKVVAKFTLNKVDKYVNGCKVGSKHPDFNDYINDEVLKASCLDDGKLRDYVEDLSFYAWHISKLEIFDEPKWLIDFKTKVYPNKKDCLITKSITKAPQNYCYVEIE